MLPKGRDTALETFIRKIRTDVECQLNNLQAKQCKDNLSPEERIALRLLRQRIEIIIEPADKGSVVVVLTKNVLHPRS